MTKTENMLSFINAQRERWRVRATLPRTAQMDLLGTDIPPVLIDAREPVAAPRWWECTYYRGVLPARAVNGGMPQLLVSVGDQPMRVLDLSRIEDAWLVKRAAERGERVAVYGLSTTLNVMGMTSPDLVQSVSVRAALIAGIKAAGLPIWAEADDWLPAIDLHTYVSGWLRHGDAASRRAKQAHFARLHAWRADRIEACTMRAFLAASGVVVSTEPIAAHARQANRLVHVIPNCVDPDEMAQTSHREKGPPVRVGMTGSRAKFYDDLPLALPGLLAVARQPETELHFFGGRPTSDEQPAAGSGEQGGGMLDGVPYHFHAFDRDILRYQREAGILDVAALPLRPCAFNRHKSGQKWMEMALHRTATVVQRLAPHDLAADGETCLKAESPEEWHEQLLRLAGDFRLRQRIGEAARNEVLARHTLAARRPSWEALLAYAGDGTRQRVASRSACEADVRAASNVAEELLRTCSLVPR